MVPSIPAFAWVADSSVANVTKPNPLERPMARSKITRTSSMSPKRSHAPFRLASVVAQARPPKNSLFFISSHQSETGSSHGGVGAVVKTFLAWTFPTG